MPDSLTTASGEAPTDMPNVIGDELSLLELRVAKRADELARHRISNREQDVEFWNQAECDVFSAGR
jgi:hypothetical protein